MSAEELQFDPDKTLQVLYRPMCNNTEPPVAGDKIKAASIQAATGFSVKSGRATAVLLAGPVQSPRLLDLRNMELSDPAVPDSRQPHHARAGALETDDIEVARRIKVMWTLLTSANGTRSNSESRACCFVTHHKGWAINGPAAWSLPVIEPWAASMASRTAGPRGRK